MKSVLIVLTYFTIVFFAGFLIFKINMFHYEKTADNRITKAMEFQKVNISEDKVENSFFNYKSGWSKMVYYNDDPEIRYEYVYDRSENEVDVFGMHKNMSLDLAKKEAKYPLGSFCFLKNGEIEDFHEL
ncbi:hypothetical protein [Bacillus sp. ISL-45]|uniref:hypothetical protein n=1 Tax=Bacillus sp. ISL-45 TaxID=2819128 RepID=UPI001BEA6703|nr:hypothetical protein [Bacillus sp. ISL-45]MBT2661684.1 hypothetical protein [Bacillus sp. ISL-45]